MRKVFQNGSFRGRVHERDHEFDEEDQPKYTQAAVARLLNVDQSTISRLASRAA
jgi:hypothetical protein